MKCLKCLLIRNDITHQNLTLCVLSLMFTPLDGQQKVQPAVGERASLGFLPWKCVYAAHQPNEDVKHYRRTLDQWSTSHVLYINTGGFTREANFKLHYHVQVWDQSNKGGWATLPPHLYVGSFTKGRKKDRKILKLIPFYCNYLLFLK